MNVHRKLITIIASLVAFCFISMIYINNREDAYPTTKQECDIPILIIDAGHGGEDGGAVAIDGTYEKDINLQIALQFQAMSALFGIDNIMIRTTDSDLADHSLPTIRKRKISDINARMTILNNHPHAVYIGIHQNQFGDEAVNGTQIFYSDGNEKAKIIAQSIQNYTISALQPTNTRKVKSAGKEIYLLYHATIPAIMVECGFISNRTECKLLREPSYGTKVSLCITGGLIQYFNTERIT